MAALIRWFQPTQQARVQGLYGSISFGAGGMAGGLLSGQAWDSLGAEVTFTLASLCAMCGLLLIWRGVSSASLATRRGGT